MFFPDDIVQRLGLYDDAPIARFRAVRAIALPASLGEVHIDFEFHLAAAATPAVGFCGHLLIISFLNNLYASA